MTGDNPQDARIIGLVPGESDQVKAEKLRAKVGDACKPMIALMDEAKELGLELSIQIETDGLGKAFVKNVTINKKI